MGVKREVGNTASRYEHTIPEGYEARIEGNKVIIELKESEDEQHRKWILEYLYDGLRKSDEQFKDQFKSAIAWLKKQGQTFTRKDVDDAYLKGICDAKYELEKQGSQNLTNSAKTCKIEPKFRVGDTIRPKGSCAKIFKITGISISEGYYKGEGSYLDIIAADDDYELVEQKPTDNIESSAFKDKLLELFQKFRWIIKGVPTNGDIIEYIDTHIQELINTIQKPDWSEEDAINFNLVYTYVPDEALRTWLKSLKERVHPQNK